MIDICVKVSIIVVVVVVVVVVSTPLMRYLKRVKVEIRILPYVSCASDPFRLSIGDMLCTP